MDKNGAVVSSAGIVLRLRPFPEGRDSPLAFNDGTKLIRLREDQIGTVQIGWKTVNDGETFSP